MRKRKHVHCHWWCELGSDELMEVDEEEVVWMVDPSFSELKKRR